MTSGSLDYGYSTIQHTWTGSKKPEEYMWFPSGSTNWIKSWFYKHKNNKDE